MLKIYKPERLTHYILLNNSFTINFGPLQTIENLGYCKENTIVLNFSEIVLLEKIFKKPYEDFFTALYLSPGQEIKYL